MGAVTAVALVTAACGEDPPNNLNRSGPPAPAQELTVVAQDTMFDITSLDAAPGQELAITFDNRDEGNPAQPACPGSRRR